MTYGLERWTVMRPRVYYFGIINIKYYKNTREGAGRVHHGIIYAIVFPARHDELINGEQKTIMTYRCLYTEVWRWHQNRLLMTSRMHLATGHLWHEHVILDFWLFRLRIYSRPYSIETGRLKNNVFVLKYTHNQLHDLHYFSLSSVNYIHHGNQNNND